MERDPYTHTAFESELLVLHLFDWLQFDVYFGNLPKI